MLGMPRTDLFDLMFTPNYRPYKSVQAYEDNRDDAVVFGLPVPGYKDVHVSVKKKHLHVTGKREARAGIPAGELDLLYSIPDDISADNATATLENGILEVTLPRIRPPTTEIPIKLLSA